MSDSHPMAGTARDARLQFETKTLATYFPHFRWYQWKGRLFAEGPLRTNSGGLYGVRVLVPTDYPSAMPVALVTHPKPLLDVVGRPLTEIGESYDMHLLKPLGDLPMICHYPAWSWGPHRTVYQVIVKSRLWLEAYEQHLRHGEPLDTWLGHVRDIEPPRSEVIL